VFRLAKWRLPTGFSFTTQYATRVKTMAITQHDNTMEEFYITHVSGKITTERLREREPCEVFRSECTIFQARKSVEVSLAYKS